MPRDGSFALAFFGRTRKLQERVLALSAGRQSFALKRILEAVFVIFLREFEKNQILLQFGLGTTKDKGARGLLFGIGDS
jgi:hypothetical protein